DDMTVMIDEIDRIARSTEFDGVNLLTGRPTMTTTSSVAYGLPKTTLPQPAFPRMAALPPGSFSSMGASVAYSLPPSALTPPSFNVAVASISGSNSQTGVPDAGTTAGRMNRLLGALRATNAVRIPLHG